MPGSSPPRSTRTSVYGPTASTPITLSRSRLGTDSLLERLRDLAAGVGDRVYGGGGAGKRGDARDARGQRSLADQVAVRAGARALRRIDDEVAAPAADEVDHGRALPVLGHLRH